MPHNRNVISSIPAGAMTFSHFVIPLSLPLFPVCLSQLSNKGENAPPKNLFPSNTFPEQYQAITVSLEDQLTRMCCYSFFAVSPLYSHLNFLFSHLTATLFRMTYPIMSYKAVYSQKGFI